jgi:putative FmdB family regulatory protein
MPIYVYSTKNASGRKKKCKTCADHFEVTQKMSDEPLGNCPECGGEIERVITAPNLGGAGVWSRQTSPDRLAKAGFTQYKRCGKGYYEKSFGKGPAALHGD